MNDALEGATFDLVNKLMDLLDARYELRKALERTDNSERGWWCRSEIEKADAKARELGESLKFWMDTYNEQRRQE